MIGVARESISFCLFRCFIPGAFSQGNLKKHNLPLSNAFINFSRNYVDDVLTRVGLLITPVPSLGAATGFLYLISECFPRPKIYPASTMFLDKAHPRVFGFLKLSESPMDGGYFFQALMSSHLLLLHVNKSVLIVRNNYL